MMRPKPVVLTIVSGFGVSPVIEGNAVRGARLPAFSHLLQTYPTVTLNASGKAVGLPEGARGSSRAGFRTIGAGRAVPDIQSRINAALDEGTVLRIPSFRRMFERLGKDQGALHVIGPVGPEGSFSARMISTILRDARDQGVARVHIHAVLQGRSPEEDRASLNVLESCIRENGAGAVASVSGSAYAGDRSRHWDRVQLAYEAIALGAPSAAWEDAFRTAETRGECGSAFVPVSISGDRVRPGDTVLFADPDSAAVRELVTAFALPAFSGFPRPPIANLQIITAVEADPDLPVETAFSPTAVEGTLGEAISAAGLRQLRIAETEGFINVTQGLNGAPAPLPGEDRVIIQGPSVSHPERAPGLASSAVADRVVKEIIQGKYDVIIADLSAPGLVSRTGDEAATVAACEAADAALGRIAEAAFAMDGVLLFVSDHGHAESLRDPATGEIESDGTRNPVPFIAAGRAYEGLKAKSGDLVGGDLALTAPAGSLADVAPTLLKILGIPKPKEMTGEALV
jgi:2,3-bisphosphoglycerate-independent phosphoglycerate mutase